MRFPTESTAEAAYILHRSFKDTGKILPCEILDNGRNEPVTIILGNGDDNKAGDYAMEWPKSDVFGYYAHLEWLKIKIKNVKGIK
jgi:hypothetical protein